MCQREGTHQFVVSFLPPVVGCLPKKTLTKGMGVTGTPAPPPPPLATPLLCTTRLQRVVTLAQMEKHRRRSLCIADPLNIALVDRTSTLPVS